MLNKISSSSSSVKLRQSTYQLRSSHSNQLVVPPVKLSTYMDLVHLLLLDPPPGTVYLNICAILNFQ